METINHQSKRCVKMGNFITKYPKQKEMEFVKAVLSSLRADSTMQLSLHAVVLPKKKKTLPNIKEDK